VTYVNAPQLAADRGVEVELVVADGDELGPDLVTVRGALPDGRTVSVSGILTTSGAREVCKLTGVEDFDLDLTADGVLLFFRYPDRPGVVGAIGTILGEAGVNIAAMQVARRSAGGEALMTLTVDSSVDAELLSAVAAEIGSARGSIVDLRGE
jgi:D-3-phosphoglycerate dehydrogenase